MIQTYRIKHWIVFLKIQPVGTSYRLRNPNGATRHVPIIKKPQVTPLEDSSCVNVFVVYGYRFQIYILYVVSDGTYPISHGGIQTKSKQK
jgi:hypothetical protein